MRNFENNRKKTRGQIRGSVNGKNHWLIIKRQNNGRANEISRGLVKDWTRNGKKKRKNFEIIKEKFWKRKKKLNLTRLKKKKNEMNLGFIYEALVCIIIILKSNNYHINS